MVGAAGQVVPYKGFVEVNLMFPASSAGTQHDVTTLALVCPNRQGKDDVPLLVGTNTSVVREMLRVCQQKGGKKFLQRFPVDSAWAQVYKVSPSLKPNGSLGPVKSVKLTVIKPGEETEVTTMVNNRSRAKREVLIEKGRTSQLPNGIEMRDSLVELPARRMTKTRIVLTNKSCKSVVIPARCRLASACSIEEKLPFSAQATLTSPSLATPCDNYVNFDFESSPLPKDIRRITELLRSRADVFSRDDLDIGCTSAVKHTINLSDETPFRMGCRRIPQQIMLMPVSI